MLAEYIVVGAGLTGCVIAHELHKAGGRVLIVERNTYIGGNSSDLLHKSGIRMHRHGPHYFRCGSDALWSFVRQFAEFYPYRAQIQALVNGRPEAWPIRREYIAQRCDSESQAEFNGVPRNFEEACLGRMPRAIYEEFIKHYTIKQWGIQPTDLAPGLAARIQIVSAERPHLEGAKKHHGLPFGGYTQMMERMIDGIPRLLACDYLQNRRSFHAGRMLIYTGGIDAFFNYDSGYLDYRSQRRETEYFPDEEMRQSVAQLNYPSAKEAAIRSIEWKHLLPAEERRRARGTLITREYPIAARGDAQLEYPVPDARNAALYKHYRRRAERIGKVLICGRLGEYRYYDMDQAIARALKLAGDLLEQHSSRIVTRTPLPASGPTVAESPPRTAC